MHIIDTATDQPHGRMQTLWAYNGLDCCITREVFDALIPKLTSSLVYDFERALQAPVLGMMLRGILIDQELRWETEQQLETERTRLAAQLNALAEAVWDAPLNANSPQQLIEFFYNVMRIPPVKRHFKGETHITTDRKALEHIQAYIWARPFVKHIFAVREHTKLLSVLRKGIDADGRIRTSYNIAGTETGRFSSSINAFGTGDNLQNWTDYVRRVCVADPGMMLAYIDLEQAESRVVGALAWRDTGQDAYWRACESSDLHTAVARMVWPELPWTGTPADRKTVAGLRFYRDFTYRDMSKRAGHASNYAGGAYTIAEVLHVERGVIESFQRLYYAAFPEILGWHAAVADKLRKTTHLTTLLGRERGFFGRVWEQETLKEAIAYEPQSVVADILNYGMYRVWTGHSDKCQLLAQLHDAILIQYPEATESTVLPEIIRALECPIPVRDKVLTIPAEASVGWNWGKFDPKQNPDGLKTWSGSDDRSRQRHPKQKLSRLHLCVSGRNGTHAGAADLS